MHRRCKHAICEVAQDASESEHAISPNLARIELGAAIVEDVPFLRLILKDQFYAWH